jgi:hypothetical protein
MTPRSPVRFSAGDVIVVRNEGPRGGPGMREMLSLTSLLKGMPIGESVALITDGRFSAARADCASATSRRKRRKVDRSVSCATATSSRSTSRRESSRWSSRRWSWRLATRSGARRRRSSRRAGSHGTPQLVTSAHTGAILGVPAVPVASYQKPTSMPASHTENGKHTAPDGASREDARQEAVLAGEGR